MPLLLIQCVLSMLKTLIKYREKYDCLLCQMNVHSWIFIQVNACVLKTFCYTESKSACVCISNNAAKYPYLIKLARQALRETKSSIILMHLRTIKAQQLISQVLLLLKWRSLNVVLLLIWFQLLNMSGLKSALQRCSSH